MKVNTRPMAIAFVGACAILLLVLYLYRGAGQTASLLGACCFYAALGMFVGKGWPVNAWQIALTASVPAWLLLGWRMYSSQDPYNIHLDLSLFIWIPVIALFSAYVGTYTSRWLAIKRRKRDALGE